MAIRFLESFGWPSLNVSGNPFLDRGFVVNGYSVNSSDSTRTMRTDQTLQRPGGGGCIYAFQFNTVNTSIRFPKQLTPTATLGFSIGFMRRGGDSSSPLNVNMGTSTTGAQIELSEFSLSYTIGGVSGSYIWNILDGFAYVEVQVSPTLIIIRVNNTEITRRSGTGFTAGTDFLNFFRGGNLSHYFKLGDIYLSDDTIFRGDCYVRLLALTATVDNTGVKEGPAATIHEGLKVFSGVDFVTYDESGEGTTVELQDIADNPSNIHGVMIRYSTAKTETDSVTAVPYVRVDNGAGYVQSDLPTHQPGPNYSPVEYPLTLDPTDNGAWTKSKVNSLRVGLRRL